jgi:hypothetical protein
MLEEDAKRQKMRPILRPVFLPAFLLADKEAEGKVKFCFADAMSLFIC